MPSQKPKRSPLLIDSFLSKYERDGIKKGTLYDTPRARRVISSLRSSLLESKRFVFDQQATKYFGELIRDFPAVIAHAQEFAIPPYETTWIELDAKTLFRTVTGLESASDADERIGFLYRGSTVYSFSGRWDDSEVSPIVYYLNRPRTLESEVKFCEEVGVSRFSLDLFFWGSPASKLASDARLGDVVQSDGKITKEFLDLKRPVLEKSAIRMLRANNSVDLFLEGKEDRRKAFEAMFDGSVGDMRNAIGLLLFLNRSNKTRYTEDVPHGRGAIGGKMKTFLSHSVIRFKLNPIPHLKKFCAGESSTWRRMHDVRGHFCTNETTKRAEDSGSCIESHDWSQIDEHHWACVRCRGMKWWRKSHVRGKPDQGLSFSAYDVTK